MGLVASLGRGKGLGGVGANFVNYHSVRRDQVNFIVVRWRDLLEIFIYPFVTWCIRDWAGEGSKPIISSSKQCHSYTVRNFI